ncbi:MAG: diacylglycerol kinase [Rubrobacteridae bacterium]|nr:diacylglycerol kinase [Rubrobacteridae bacterium]
MVSGSGRSLLQSFNYAIDGFVYVLRTQRNMRIHFGAAFIALTLALFLKLQTWAVVALIFAAVLVIVAEMINTAIEATIDLVTNTYDPIAGIAKDVAAGAVLLASVNAILVAYFVFFSKLNPFSLSLLQKVRQSPSHLTVIALLIVIIIVLAAKAWIGGGSFLKGGWPSGHSALAGALFTAIAFVAESPLASRLGLGLALLVFHSRMDAGIHISLVLGGVLPDWLFLVLILILIGISAILTAFRTALRAVSRLRVRYLAEQNAPGARTLENLIIKPSRLMSSLILIDNSSNILAVALATAYAQSYFADYAVLISSVAMIFLILILQRICQDIRGKTY